MNNWELTTFAGRDELAASVAATWLRLVRTAATGRELGVALSGGRIAKELFYALAQQSRGDPAALRPVHFFWADERCVTTADPGSNFRSAHECLFEPLGIEPSRIHRIRGEIAPELAAAEAEAELRRFAPPNATGQPVLDLVLLGMGEDGHVASLFPGESESERRSPRVYRPVVAPKPPPRRITLGYGVLAAAREVWVLVSGAGKEAALAESLSAEGQTPLAHVLRSRKRTRVFSDSPIRESA